MAELYRLSYTANEINQKLGEVEKKADKEYVDNQINDYIKNASPCITGEGENSVVENDLVNNKALGDYSHASGLETQASAIGSSAEGRKTVASGDYSNVQGNLSTSRSINAFGAGFSVSAGGRGFRIIRCIPESEAYELSSVTGLEIGQTYSIRLNSVQYAGGTIKNINGNIVTVSNYDTALVYDDSEYNSPDNSDFNIDNIPTLENYFMIVGRPDLGDIDVAFNAVAFGENTQATDRDAFAAGRDTKAIGQYSTAVGRQTIAGYASFASGRKSQALGETSTAEGYDTLASGNATHAEGHQTKATNHYAHSEGYRTEAQGEAAHAEGYLAVAKEIAAHAEGLGTIASARAAHAEGDVEAGESSYKESIIIDSVEYKLSNGAAGIAAHREGRNTSAEGNYSHTEGFSTAAIGLCAHAENTGTIALGKDSHAEGQNTMAKGEASHTEGSGSQAKGHAAHAEGRNSVAEAIYSHAEGYQSVAKGEVSHAEGHKTSAEANYSHTEGLNTIAKGDAAHAEGNKTLANANYSHAEGYLTQALGLRSHAEGDKSSEGYSLVLTSNGEIVYGNATGHYSHREGRDTESKGIGSHAEGERTTAYGGHSHAEGYRTEAIGAQSHAEGYLTIAEGNYSHSSGLNTIAKAEAQTVVGKYNTEDDTATFVVGTGKANNTRNNAFTAGNDGTNDYITIGEEKLTEGELQSVKEISTLEDIVTVDTLQNAFKQLYGDVLDIPSIGLAYNLNENNKEYSVGGMGTCTDVDIVVSSKYKGLSVTSIGNEAFYTNRTFKNITIGNNITSIGDMAFYWSSLTGITISDSLTSIGSSAFYGCSNLESIVVDDKNTVYHSAGNCLIETASKTLILGCKNSIIPSDGSVTSIDGDAFQGNDGLEKIDISNGVTSISDWAFMDCYNLMNVTISDSVTSIGYGAFSGCSSALTLDCSACTSIPTLTDSQGLGNLSAGAKIIVPAFLLEDWKAATNWSAYAYYIVAAE